MTSAFDTVSALLAAAGLELSVTDQETAARAYPKLRAAVDRLYDVASADEEPILVFMRDAGWVTHNMHGGGHQMHDDSCEQ